MSGLLDARELLVQGETVTLPIPVAAPLAKCTLDAAISTARGGPAVHPALERALVVRDGAVPALVLYSRDLRALLPRGGRAWLVVRYAGQLLATGPVTLVVG